MSQALTLTEAAERLAPVFEESRPTSLEKPAEGKWMSLENAGALLAERVAGQGRAPQKKKAEVSIKQAANQIGHPELETPAELVELRGEQLIAAATAYLHWQELETFVNRAAGYFHGRDEASLSADPQYLEVCAYAQQLRANYDAAQQAGNDLWSKRCTAENKVFEAGRPEWGAKEAKQVGKLMNDLGVSEQEVQQLWLTPQPIDVTSPVCTALARLSIGEENPAPIPAALEMVGFDDEEIKAVMAGEASVFLRDHRIQELVARAADANAPTENRRAA